MHGWPLPSAPIAALAGTCAGTGPAWPAQLTAEFYKLVALHELPPVRLHDLRHGKATHALTAGIDVKLVQGLLGHAISSFTRDVYIGVADQARREAAKTLTSIFTRSPGEQRRPSQ